mmetsp:Transcript_52450/g.147212  ORF Transcript_52450/g.147212 Transcript_52450/m.147212 type:complete len:238 (-) Transcript_52450:374-1087(-)
MRTCSTRSTAAPSPSTTFSRCSSCRPPPSSRGACSLAEVSIVLGGPAPLANSVSPGKQSAPSTTTSSPACWLQRRPRHGSRRSSEACQTLTATTTSATTTASRWMTTPWRSSLASTSASGRTSRRAWDAAPAPAASQDSAPAGSRRGAQLGRTGGRKTYRGRLGTAACASCSSCVSASRGSSSSWRPCGTTPSSRQPTRGSKRSWTASGVLSSRLATSTPHLSGWASSAPGSVARIG